MEKKGTNWLMRKTTELPSTFKKHYPIDGHLQPSYGVLEFLQIRWQANLLLGNHFFFFFLNPKTSSWIFLSDNKGFH